MGYHTIPLARTISFEKVSESEHDLARSGPSTRVDTTVNVTERQNATFTGGGGISAKGLQEGGLSALIANADFFRRNLFRRCQSLTARVEISPSNFGSKPEIDIKLAHQDPWIGDAHRTSRRVFLDCDSSTLQSIHARAEPVGEEDEPGLGAADEGPKGVFVRRVVSGVEYRRPLAACWTVGFRTPRSFLLTRCRRTPSRFSLSLTSEALQTLERLFVTLCARRSSLIHRPIRRACSSSSKCTFAQFDRASTRRG